MNDAPAERIRAAYAGWAESRGQDGAAFVALAHPELQLRSPLIDAAAGGAEPRGPEGVAQFLAAILRDWEMLDFTTDQIVAQDDTVVWIGHCSWRHRASGREIATDKIDVWHFREGRAVRFAEMFDTLGFARTAGMI
jgi:ketosteroid isomerase-like protein